MDPPQLISTANQPPGRPLAVCWIALLPTSLAMQSTSSRAGHSGSSDDSHRRNSEGSWRRPWNIRCRRRSCVSGWLLEGQRCPKASLAIFPPLEAPLPGIGSWIF
jgi:hypothetical protein